MVRPLPVSLRRLDSCAIPWIRTSCIRLSGVYFECATGPALADHLLAVGVEGIVDDPLGGVLLVVVLEAQMPEALSNRLQPLSFRLVPERVVGIRAVDDLAEQDQRCIVRQVVLLEDSLKRTFFAMMAQFHIFHIIGHGPLSFSHLHHLIVGDEQELGVLIDKFPDEPGTGHAIYFDVFARNPLHRDILLLPAHMLSSSSSLLLDRLPPPLPIQSTLHLPPPFHPPLLPAPD